MTETLKQCVTEMNAIAADLLNATTNPALDDNKALVVVPVAGLATAARRLRAVVGDLEGLAKDGEEKGEGGKEAAED
jgi:hypothetical protein